ncbi:MAG: hypothetical protein N4A72_06710 [Bacteroidales bacterium]|nr:hypothetical protein [Bacteroidales bacterium]
MQYLTKRTLSVLVFMTTILLLFSGCFVTYGDKTHVSSRVVDTTKRVKTAEIYLIDETTDSIINYTQIATVKAMGGYKSSDENVMNYLKYEAWKLGANGLTAIIKDTETREKGRLLSDKEPDYYQATVYRGLAIKIDKDSAFIKRYGAVGDTTFIKRVKQDVKKEKKRNSNQVSASLIGGFAAAIITLIVLLAQ